MCQRIASSNSSGRTRDAEDQRDVASHHWLKIYVTHLARNSPLIPESAGSRKDGEDFLCDSWHEGKRVLQLTGVELPNYFTEDEWNDLKDLNRRTNRRIHDGKVPTTSKGKPYIILPHAIFSGDRVDRYKDIARRADVVWEASEFEVKDEDEFSGSSRSSSTRSDGA
ncbi:unnamed protein product [Phytophthora lilii]|uniref:Unnamed protein product n=1 Tax=Phytophthora lilii TaxID=2077276 RepID=A0A9W6UAH7_9STRA|nr:unnamed protein product [Phytophthora lilii]